MNLPGNSIRSCTLSFICFAFLLTLSTSEVQGQQRFFYSNLPLKQVIEDIEQRSTYRFLYRDAVITGKKISLDTSSEQLVSRLQEALIPQRVQLQYDATHQQIMLSDGAFDSPIRSLLLTGYVLDHTSGARLPFANLSWMNEGYLQGVSTNESGFFQIQLDNVHGEQDHLTLSVSYVGYQPQRVHVDFANPPSDLAIRLKPATIQSQEVLVSSNVLRSNVDTTWHYLLNPGLFSPFGESSVIRSLNGLPAVALSTALSDGLNVRGSKADGFQVLLDGAPIYNQNHFFGMFDAFNADALQTVGFYYDIAPASYFAPPGGTISFLTRTGSLSDVRATLASSNTSVRGTIEGPLVKGKMSWLLSGRHSYLDAVNWFNNQQIIGIGLDTNRKVSDLPLNAEQVDDFLITPKATEARFFDAHGKVTAETRRGMRATLSFYLGGNKTDLVADRLSIERHEMTNQLRVTEEETETSNKWGNEAVSLQLHHRLGERTYFQTTLAASHYLSRFSKDDFVYTRINPTTNQLRNFVFPFNYENELLDLKWEHHLDIAPSRPGLWSFGVDAHYYAITYSEQSATRPSFGEDYYAIQGDLYAEYERSTNFLDVRVGLRGHYYTQGNVFRLSPRVQATFLPKARISFRLGFSKNYQFLHQLYLENTNSSSIWVMTTGAQGPSTVDNVTAGLYIRATSTSFVQIEGYYRSHEKLRRHEINAPAQLTTSNSQRFVPWFSENDAIARGLEFMYRQRIGPLLWTHSYTLSKVELENEEVYNGAPFPAEWDRRHQYTTHAQFPITKWLSTQFTWFYATGNPDVLTYSEDRFPSRLPDYHRLDASIQMNQHIGNSLLKITLSAYNLYNAENTWYREKVRVFNPERPALGTTFVDVNVFDLGIQPSFDVSFSF